MTLQQSLKNKNPSLWKEIPPFCHLSSSAFSWPEALKIISVIKPLGEALSWCMFAFGASLLVVYGEPNEQMTPGGKFCLFPQRSAQKREQHGHMTWGLRDTTVTFTAAICSSHLGWPRVMWWVWHSTSLCWGVLAWPTHLLERSFHSWKGTFAIFAIFLSPITCIIRDVKGLWLFTGLSAAWALLVHAQSRRWNVSPKSSLLYGLWF